MTKPVKSVVVVGGGSAGWITAGLIAARHRATSPEGIRVTLIESPDIATVGVGEGTWPTMRNTLIKLGITETDFLRHCDATFKQGAKFARWTTGETNDYYYHPLVLPQGFPEINLAPYWQTLTEKEGPAPSFSQAVCFQEALCERGLAPKRITTPEFGAIANYAYHLDSGKFVTFLQDHCTRVLGVRHVRDNVTGVVAADNGDIAHLETQAGGPLAGDLFVDCTGFSSLLLGRHYGVGFRDCGDVLFIDRALAVQVPYDTPDAAIASHTISTAQKAGWIWDIGLPTRRGVGYVYSSRHSDEDAAMAELRAYVGPALDDLTVRRIPIHAGHRETFWKRNCVAVGLSAGFLEPLEASALVLIELSADMIAQQFPVCRDVMDITARRFNETFHYRWDRIIDFLKLHYCLSRRTDTAFWRDNRDPASLTESLKELMALWRYQPPGDHDFSSNNEVFPAASYQYVLYGMGFRSDLSHSRHTLTDMATAQKYMAQNARAVEKLTGSLPSNRDLIRKVHTHGFQRI